MKRILILSLFAVLSLSTNAQMTTLFGFKAGANISGMTADDYSESFRKPGFYAGILSEFSFSEYFSIQSELLYATYGAEVYLMTLGAGIIDTYYSLNYILFPMAVKYYFNRNLSVDFGPSFNLLVRDKAYRPGLPDLYDKDGNFLRSQSVVDPDGSRLEWSGFVGVTYRLCSSWAASFRYTQSFSGAFGSKLVRSDDKNNAFQIGLQYQF